MNNAQTKMVLGMIVGVIFLAAAFWLGFKAWSEPPYTSIQKLTPVPVQALEDEVLQVVADITKNEGNYYGLPVTPPNEDELGKDRLF